MPRIPPQSQSSRYRTDLYEVKSSVNVVLHHEYSQVAVGLPNAVVQHPDENVGIVSELYH